VREFPAFKTAENDHHTMPANIIDGKSIAAGIRQDVRESVESRAQNGLHTPGLAVILVGKDPASEVYVSKKREACAEAGILSKAYDLADSTSEAELLDLISQLNDDAEIDGILVQLPLPEHIDTTTVIEAIDPGNDVDGFHPDNIGRLAQLIQNLRPCTPYGVIKVQEHIGKT